MQSYWYLLSSLPTLSWDGETSYTLDAFWADVDGRVDAKVYDALKRAVDVPREPWATEAQKPQLIGDWHHFEAALRWDMEAFRIAAASTGERADLPHYVSVLTPAAKEALSQANPLEAELSIDKLRWDYIERLVGVNSFSLAALLGYVLQLQIKERQGFFSKELGRSTFDRVFKALQEQVISPARRVAEDAHE